VEDDGKDVESRDSSDGASGNEEQCTNVDNEDDDDEEEDSEATDDGIPAITHCVIFKCIGCTKSTATGKCSLMPVKAQKRRKRSCKARERTQQPI